MGTCASFGSMTTGWRGGVEGMNTLYGYSYRKYSTFIVLPYLDRRELLHSIDYGRDMAGIRPHLSGSLSLSLSSLSTFIIITIIFLCFLVFSLPRVRVEARRPRIARQVVGCFPVPSRSSCDARFGLVQSFEHACSSR
ncbi:hypothetical protein LZ32DRAFT_459534 [Colletotrichum eremochloae]|nr:hypothetical protein LZ32DRAFT_459534 [Colletotrichum eremochloae]